MKKIDMSEWGEFRVGDLFEQYRGKEKAPKQNAPGKCQLIQETNLNNGIDRLVKPTKQFEGNAITVSINYARNVFYQKETFCASVNIAILYNKNINEYSGKFICTILSALHTKYTYTNKISKEKLENEVIRLPIDTAGSPNWAYMEEYMKKMEEEAKKKIAKLKEEI